MIEEIKKEYEYLLQFTIPTECDSEEQCNEYYKMLGRRECLKEILDEYDNQPDYKKLVEHLKTLHLGTQELDYDYDDEAILNFEYFDWDLYIENWFEVEKYNLGGE